MAKVAVEPLEHEAWFRAEVQRALHDPHPGISHDAVMDQTRAIIDRIARKKVRALLSPEGAD